MLGVHLIANLSTQSDVKLTRKLPNPKYEINVVQDTGPIFLRGHIPQQLFVILLFTPLSTFIVDRLALQNIIQVASISI